MLLSFISRYLRISLHWNDLGDLQMLAALWYPPDILFEKVKRRWLFHKVDSNKKAVHAGCKYSLAPMEGVDWERHRPRQGEFVPGHVLLT